HDGKDEKIYDFIKPLVRLVKDSARGDRDYILSVAKSLAARLKKNRRA
ncbi:MAG: hypothetical protein HY747_00995, partial [Elusimicrobia bacterium]|nr:hypothetical protein [Elusimicrobiota bacterium]